MGPLPQVASVTTARLVLRSWDPGDAPALKRAVDESLDHLLPWMPWARDEPSPLPEVVARLTRFAAEFQRGEDWVYGIFSREDGRVLGGTGLHPRLEPGALEIGYWIHVGEVGRGFATEAAGALTRVGIEAHGARRVEIRCDPANAPSAAVPRKLGYRHVETLEGHDVTPEGEPRDTMRWVMTAEELSSSPAGRVEVRMHDARGEPLP